MRHRRRIRRPEHGAPPRSRREPARRRSSSARYAAAAPRRASRSRNSGAASVRARRRAAPSTTATSRGASPRTGSSRRARAITAPARCSSSAPVRRSSSRPSARSRPAPPRSAVPGRRRAGGAAVPSRQPAGLVRGGSRWREPAEVSAPHDQGAARHKHERRGQAEPAPQDEHAHERHDPERAERQVQRARPPHGADGAATAAVLTRTALLSPGEAHDGRPPPTSRRRGVGEPGHAGRSASRRRTTARWTPRPRPCTMRTSLSPARAPDRDTP